MKAGEGEEPVAPAERPGGGQRPTSHFWDVAPTQTGGLGMSFFRRTDHHRVVSIGAMILHPAFGQIDEAEVAALGDRLALQFDALLHQQAPK